MDFLLETNLASPNYHDIVWNNGPLTQEFTTQPFTQTVAQRLLIRLLNWRGEWFLDTEYGVPYLEILGQKRGKESVDLVFQQEILKENGVKEIVSFDSTFENRIYSATFQVKVVNGEVSQPITITI